ncbi:MAG: neutral/alkaline non-lysosomal ceramidase N-terminal domain-containing protein [Clostridia bacterium]|nr:neutral/alkaline non-lysosomal ceramidase N-terminal domain-containing protein [Clostridia bacterium]
MKTGFSKICITPPYGTPITGYFAPRYTKGVIDNLYARAVAFNDGKKNAAILALDLCNLGKEYCDNIKEAITKVADIDADAIFINCSHTHTGPLVGEDESLGAKTDESYVKTLIESARDAVLYAIDDLKESRIEVAQGKAENISFCRRYRMKDGSVATNPGVNNPEIDHALGTPNETVKLVKIIREGAKDIFMVSFGTHSDSVGGEYISADYIGFVCDILENAVPDTNCIFIQGIQGDVNHVNVNPTKGESAISVIDFDSVPRSIKHAEHMGRIIAGAVLSVCSITEEVKADKLSYGVLRVDLPSYQQNHRLEEARKIHELYTAGRANELPYKEMELTTVVAEAERIIKLENGPDFYSFFLSAVGIGDLVFVGIGGEVFTDIGNRILEKSPFKNTVACALTNGDNGYVPTAKAYDEGGYEARSSHLKPGGDDIIVEGTVKLLNSIK